MSTTVQSQQTALDRLRARREQLGLSQTELARRTGLRLDRIGRIERGQIDPRLSVVLVLADELDYPPEQLFGGAAGP
jgi:transcriptional regulator with XRE-family HTH domain